jgi:hypothetical protein
VFYGNDNDFIDLLRRNGPIFAHDLRLANTAMGEYAVFGERGTSDAWAAIVKSMKLGSMAPSALTDPQKRLREATGITTKF